MKREEAADQKRMAEIATENRRMNEPLKSALQDVRKLQDTLKQYEADKEELRRTKAELVTLEDQIARLQWEHDVLQQR